MLARALGYRRLARQQSAKILETDCARQQAQSQRADTNSRKFALSKAPPSM
jgi:hypothetical protein